VPGVSHEIRSTEKLKCASLFIVGTRLLRSLKLDLRISRMFGYSDPVAKWLHEDIARENGMVIVRCTLADERVPVWGQSAGTASSATSQTQSDESVLQEEVGDRDLTYLRTRTVFQYDYKEQVEDVTINRTRLKLLYAFGPHQNMAVSVMVPAIWMSTATQSAFASGDMEITAGWVVYASDTFRTGGLVQVQPQTSSENLIGGASTNLKGTGALAWVLSGRFEFTRFFSYKQSVHVSRGGSIKQFEPDVTLNVRIKKSTLFVESDSY